MDQEAFKDWDVPNPILIGMQNKKESDWYNHLFESKSYNPDVRSTSILCTHDETNTMIQVDTHKMEVIGNRCAWLTNWAFSYRGVSEAKVEYDFVEALEELPSGALILSPYINATSPYSALIVRINSEHTVFMYKDHLLDRVAFGLLDANRLTVTSCIDVMNINTVMQPIGGISMYKQLITGNLE